MSLIHQHRVNSLYNHQRSIAERAPPTEISPTGKLKLKQYDEQRKLAERHQAESNKLNDDHNDRRNNDVMFRSGGALSQHIIDKEADEREALRGKHQRESQTMKQRHFHEMEAALKKHGTAP